MPHGSSRVSVVPGELPGLVDAYVAALLAGGTNEHGSVLKPETLASMFEPHYQPDPRLPGMGLGFFRDEMGGHPDPRARWDMARLPHGHGARS